MRVVEAFASQELEESIRELMGRTCRTHSQSSCSAVEQKAKRGRMSAFFSALFHRLLILLLSCRSFGVSAPFDLLFHMNISHTHSALFCVSSHERAGVTGVHFESLAGSCLQHFSCQTSNGGTKEMSYSSLLSVFCSLFAARVS